MARFARLSPSLMPPSWRQSLPLANKQHQAGQPFVEVSSPDLGHAPLSFSSEGTTQKVEDISHSNLRCSDLASQTFLVYTPDNQNAGQLIRQHSLSAFASM